ncbi:MAG: peptidase domain-containing ABC transporter [Gammaproteobacteria bacterium]
MAVTEEDIKKLIDDERLPLSERLSNAIRNKTYSKISELSPYAACILPILTELGWRSYKRELIESIPHFTNHIDLVDLRNMLVTLGYESDEKKTSVKNICPTLLPCLFVSDTGAINVITEISGDNVTYFDAHRNDYCSDNILKDKGTAYFFTDMHPTHAMTGLEQSGDQWFTQTLKRFKKLVKHLVAMTFMLNIIAMFVPLFIMVVYDNVIGARSTHSIPYLVTGIAIALACELIFRLVRSKTLGLLAGRLDYIIGVETFKKIMSLPPTLTERSTVISQLSRLRQFESIRDFFTGPSATLFLELPFVILFIALLAVLGGSIALVPMVMIGIYLLFGWLWFPSLNKKLVHAGHARSARQRMLMETFSGLRELKALGAEGAWLELYREASGEAMTRTFKTSTSHSLINSVAQSLMTIAGISVLALGTLKVMNEEMTIGALIAVMALIWRVLSPLQGVCLAMLQIDQITQSIKQLNQLMRVPSEPNSYKAGLIMPKITGKINFDRVTFRYAPNEDPAVVGASFSIEPGEFVAVVGSNGSGKSSVLKLVAGMYRAQAGTLTIDNTDVRQMNATDLRRVIAYMPQKPSLFYGTIAQNIRLNQPLATDEQLLVAAEQAGILSAIKNLLNGFDTLVGDHTTSRLPSGLVHGICLARSYVRKAPVFLMDEPGTSLDKVTDQNLMNHLEKMRGKQTILMVSHRPSHIRLADKAIVMVNGMVAHVGTPGEAIKYLTEMKK